MLVKELIEVLKEADPEARVIMSSDEEGNMYSILFNVNNYFVWAPKGSHFGELYFGNLTPELSKHYTEEDLYDGTDGEPAVVLYPSR
jgi:hypothetical protein